MQTTRAPVKFTYKYLDISEKILREMGDLQYMKSIWFFNCSIDNEALSALESLSKLEKLDFILCNLSDAGLKHIAGIRGLSTLTLRRTDVSTEGLAQFRSLRPDVTVEILSDKEKGVVKEVLPGRK
ncbi:MAG: hypothetical protein ACKVT0_08300 [Planctomycetaceae bacterium]